jgi:hypothetical protein
MKHLGLFALLLSACAPTAKAVRVDGQLSVACAVANARVYVDDIFAGRAVELRGRALLVPTGAHRVEVRAEGYFSAYRDVKVMPHQRETVAVDLHRIPDNEPGE